MPQHLIRAGRGSFLIRRIVGGEMQELEDKVKDLQSRVSTALVHL